MKKRWQISARNAALLLIGWLIVADLLVSLVYFTDWWLYKLVLFISISFLPGVVLLRIMRIALRTFSVRALYSFGLSVLVLMLSGLAANQILPIFGVSRPLTLPGALGAWNSITLLLIAISTFTNRHPIHLQKPSLKKFSKPAWLLIGLSALLPCIAALGAFRLNNGGDALLAECTLVYAAVLIIYVFLLRHRLSDGVLAWFVFIIGLTILLMTSLRGWDIVGHDIEREFRVYTATHLLARWSIGLNRDPYSACLSITILPEMFAKLLNTSGLVVFKLILQAIFAACPAVVYVLLRQYVPKLGALLGSMLFICYPTFINDSAMLTRQGIAYLFFALALLVISNRAQKKRYKLLFSLCALGAVLSHYSTAYMFVALFAGAVVCKLLISWWQSRPHKPSRSKAQGITWWQKDQQPTSKARTQRTVLSPIFAGLLFILTFLWYVQITGTSGGLMVTLHKSLANIPKLFSEDNKSSDTSTALLFAGGKTQVDLYESYLTSSKPLRNSVSTPARTNTTDYFPTLVSDDLPLTSIGKGAISIGVNPSVITSLRQNFAKVLQLLALAGVLYATYRLLKRKPDTLDPDFICLNLAGIGLLVLMVVLPVLSINYGILRAFQQTLIFLLLPIIILLVNLGQRLWAWVGVTSVTFSIVFLFLLFTGLFAQVLGGTSPSLSMDNQGLYFGLYYSSAADVQSLAWLRTHVPKDKDVRIANFNRALMHDPQYPFSATGILPSQVGTNSIIYLDPAQVLAKKLYTYYSSSPLIMTFPLDYYEQTRNLIYSTTSTRVYR